MRSGHDDACGQPCQSGDIEHVEVGQRWRFDWAPTEGQVVALERGTGGVIRSVTLDMSGDGNQTVTLIPGQDSGTWTRLDGDDYHQAVAQLEAASQGAVGEDALRAVMAAFPSPGPTSWHYGSLRSHLATGHAISSADDLAQSRAIHWAVHTLYPERLSHSHPNAETP